MVGAGLSVCYHAGSVMNNRARQTGATYVCDPGHVTGRDGRNAGGIVLVLRQTRAVEGTALQLEPTHLPEREREHWGSILETEGAQQATWREDGRRKERKKKERQVKKRRKK